MSEDREQEDIDRALNEVFRSAAGKRVLFWILSECSIYHSPYAGENAAATNFELGKQDVGRRIIARLDKIDPRFYPQLLLDIADLKAMDRVIAETARRGKENDDEIDA